MARRSTTRKLQACPENWSSDEELNAPTTVPISSRERMMKEGEREIEEIKTIRQLTLNESRVIKILCDGDSLVATKAKAAHAREIVEQFRRETLYHNQPEYSKPNPTGKDASPVFHSQPFDRLIYLLDRYTEYCTSIGLSAWPIHHLKVAIWIKGDVISLKTRVIPLRKTVRCYITTMETVRVKTRHVFYQACEPDQNPLITRPILKELLDVLPISRSCNLDSSNSEEENIIGGVDRSTLLQKINSHSGDSMAKEALMMVQVARERTGRNDSALRYGKKKPDPHMHTLSRYMAFCRSVSIPIWPIESLRVSLWLRESVLSPASPEYTGYKVSLRTVQVYLSRLEYARLRTEFLFKDSFGELATVSLYRSQAIVDILESFNPNHEKKLGMLSEALEREPSAEQSPVLGKRKLPTDSLLGEASKYREYSSHCRPQISSSRSSLVPLTGEDSRSESQASSRSRSSSFSSADHESSLTAYSEQDSFTRQSPNARKGCLSYILCSHENDDDSFQLSKKPRTGNPSTPSFTDDLSTPARWEISPLRIPRSQYFPPRFTIPSFATFDFAHSDLDLE